MKDRICIHNFYNRKDYSTDDCDGTMNSGLGLMACMVYESESSLVLPASEAGS